MWFLIVKVNSITFEWLLSNLVDLLYRTGLVQLFQCCEHFNLEPIDQIEVLMTSYKPTEARSTDEHCG
jgi:uncharacterized protein YwlG (UPF0340 family)